MLKLLGVNVKFFSHNLTAEIVFLDEMISGIITIKLKKQLFLFFAESTETLHGFGSVKKFEDHLLVDLWFDIGDNNFVLFGWLLHFIILFLVDIT